MKYSLVDLLEVKESDFLEPKKSIKPPYQIYCDMDGVLCDFAGRFDHFTGMSPNEYKDTKGSKMFWKLISDVGEVFWSEMEWTPKGRELWKFIEPYKPQLLTAPSFEQSSRDGKLLWVSKNLPSWVKVNFRPAEKKQELANPNTILIDDKESTIMQWNSQNGIAIHHPENTINLEPIYNKLKELGYDR